MYTVIELTIKLKLAVLLIPPHPKRSDKLALAAEGCWVCWLLWAAAQDEMYQHINTLSLTHFSQIHAVSQDGA